jgi:hypothetical protein
VTLKSMGCTLTKTESPTRNSPASPDILSGSHPNASLFQIRKGSLPEFTHTRRIPLELQLVQFPYTAQRMVNLSPKEKGGCSCSRRLVPRSIKGDGQRGQILISRGVLRMVVYGQACLQISDKPLNLRSLGIV